MSARPWYQRRAAAWFTVLVCGGIAAAMLRQAATVPSDRTMGLVVGAFLGSVALLVAVARRRPRMRWEPSRLDDRPAWRLGLGRPAQAVVLALVTTSATVLLGAWAGSGGTGSLLLLGPPALFLAVLAVETWRIVVRRPCLVLGVDAVELRGTGLDARMAWADVTAVRYDDRALYLAVTLAADGAAPSYVGRRRRWVLPTDRRPDPTRLPVRVSLVADPAALLTLLRELHRADPSVRASRLAGPPPSP